MKELPRFVGYTEIPIHLKDYNGLSRTIVRRVHKGEALQLEASSPDSAKKIRRALSIAGLREFGSGRMQTAIDGNFIYCWLRMDEPDLLSALKQVIVLQES